MKFYVFVYCLAGIVKKKILSSFWVKVIIYAGDVDFKWRWLLSSCKSGSRGGVVGQREIVFVSNNVILLFAHWYCQLE
jgi:hypothetical protein